MLAVTRPEIERGGEGQLARFWPYKNSANVFLVTTSILPSVSAGPELHVVLPLAGRYSLGMVFKSTINMQV